MFYKQSFSCLLECQKDLVLFLFRLSVSHIYIRLYCLVSINVSTSSLHNVLLSPVTSFNVLGHLLLCGSVYHFCLGGLVFASMHTTQHPQSLFLACVWMFPGTRPERCPVLVEF